MKMNDQGLLAKLELTGSVVLLLHGSSTGEDAYFLPGTFSFTAPFLQYDVIASECTLRHVSQTPDFNTSQVETAAGHCIQQTI